MRYLVTIFYREPTYELEVGRKASPYRWRFDDIDVASEPEAVAEATRRFREIERLSGVGWQRDVLDVAVTHRR